MTRLSRTVTLALALCWASACAAEATPRRAELGMSLAQAQALYSAAKLIKGPRGAPARLEFAEADFADMHWKKVAMLFDAQNRLDKVQLTTTVVSFDRLKQTITANLDDFLSTEARSERVVAPVASIQLRICDHGAAGVDLIFERESAPI